MAQITAIEPTRCYYNVPQVARGKENDGIISIKRHRNRHLGQALLIDDTLRSTINHRPDNEHESLKFPDVLLSRFTVVSTFQIQTFFLIKNNYLLKTLTLK